MCMCEQACLSVYTQCYEMDWSLIQGVFTLCVFYGCKKINESMNNKNKCSHTDDQHVNIIHFKSFTFKQQNSLNASV